MEGVVRVRTIAFTPDRMPTLRRIRLGYEGDNLVERLEFDLPEITAGQTATLMITGADAVTLDRTDEGRYAVDLTRDMIGPDGEREAYVRIDGTGGEVWQSAVMRMVTGALPDVEEEIEKVYPTAVGQMLTAMAEHSSEMNAQEERVEQAAQRAEEAAEKAEAGGGSGSGGSAVEIDATLTVQGAAADAKAAGEAVSKLSKEIMNVKGVEPALMDIPKIFFGASLPQTKTESVMSFRYVSQTQDINCSCETKAQGNSSMSYPKKNQTTKLFTDYTCKDKVKVDFKGWGKQNKFCLKANWIDLSHARNIVSARIWADLVRSRDNFAELPELLRTSPNMGAIDGFPVKVYAAGKYQGRYTLNIPKDKWLTNMDDENPNHCILCGEDYGSGCFRAAAKIDGSDWSDEIHDTVPENIKTRWNEIITFVANSTNEEFVANLDNYFDVPSLIDYYLFGLAICNLDGFGKNQLYFTYDGLKWIASVYDMDMTWGLNANINAFVGSDYARTNYEDFVAGRQGNLLYIRLAELFVDAIKARWMVLRDGALSVSNIINHFERFTDIASDALVAEDYAETTADGAFTSIPLKDTNDIRQLRAYALARFNYVDNMYAVRPESSNIWSISDKQESNLMYYAPSSPVPFEDGYYHVGVARNGYWNKNTTIAPQVTIDGEDITMVAVASGSAGWGVAVPIGLIPGEVYKLSFDIEQGCTIASIMYYNDDKIHQRTDEYSKESDGVGHYETTFTARDYPYAFSLFTVHNGADTVTAGTTIKVANVAIEKIG